jgi:transcriptional regulator with XRE-family HTH domain
MPDTFNHTLLLLARQYRERSQSEVARAAGLTQGHYSRIENGLLPEGPSEESVAKIARVLSFPPAFFYQQEKAVGMPLSVHPFHRKKQSVGERALRRVHAELNFRLMHLRKLLESVDATQVLPLPWLDVDEGGGPREIARKIRSVDGSSRTCGKSDRAGGARRHRGGLVRVRRGHRRRDNGGTRDAPLYFPEPLNAR